MIITSIVVLRVRNFDASVTIILYNSDYIVV